MGILFSYYILTAISVLPDCAAALRISQTVSAVLLGIGNAGAFLAGQTVAAAVLSGCVAALLGIPAVTAILYRMPGLSRQSATVTSGKPFKTIS